MIEDWMRAMFSNLARVMCKKFVKTIPRRRDINNRAGDAVYLERYYLFGGPSEEGEWADSSLQVCVHRFCRSDEDGALHNHPWEQSVSFILAGGYIEERRVGDQVETRLHQPFDFNLISANDFHRVDLIEDDCWTIFVSGKKTQSWGFWDRNTKIFKSWREFIGELRGVDPSSLNDNVTKENQ
jgi:hypothetical protein